MPSPHIECSLVKLKQPAYPQISLLRVLLSADLAGERFFSGVRHQVALHGGHAHEPLSAHAAHRQDLRRALSNACPEKITVLQLSVETVIFKMQVDNWIDILTENPLYEQLQTKVEEVRK